MASEDNNKRIAKNTLALYVRMFFQLLLSLYTSRLVLNLLGIEDFGIYSVVGGLVAIVSYINQAMSTSSMRFISFSLGNEGKNIANIFGSAIVNHLILAGIVVIIAETIGLWFLQKEMIIPSDRVFAATWVFQLSVMSTIFVIISLPYTALIIASEKMSIFAYFTIVDAIFKLCAVLILYLLPYDRLIEYSLFMFIVQLIYTGLYVFYCLKNFPFTRKGLIYDSTLGKKMMRFASWSMFGCSASIANTQGVNMLLNIFGGPVLNAARGIAVQVQGVINNFAVNFQTAVNPQIIKYYAQDSFNELHKLMVRSAKFSFFLLLLMILPVSLNIDIILRFWLGIVPKYTSVFVILIMASTLIDSLSSPLMKGADASGNIRRYHIMVGCFLLLLLPVAWILLKVGFPPYSVFVAQIVFSIIALFIRLRIVSNLVNLSSRYYISKAVVPCLTILGVVIAPTVFVKLLTFDLGIIGSLILSSIVSVALLIALIWIVGLDSGEKQFVKSKICYIKTIVLRRP